MEFIVVGTRTLVRANLDYISLNTKLACIQESNPLEVGVGLRVVLTS